MGGSQEGDLLSGPDEGELTDFFQGEPEVFWRIKIGFAIYKLH
jgi:hypothetical protein